MRDYINTFHTICVKKIGQGYRRVVQSRSQTSLPPSRKDPWIEVGHSSPVRYYQEPTAINFAPTSPLSSLEQEMDTFTPYQPLLFCVGKWKF